MKKPSNEDRLRIEAEVLAENRCGRCQGRGEIFKPIVNDICEWCGGSGRGEPSYATDKLCKCGEQLLYPYQQCPKGHIQGSDMKPSDQDADTKDTLSRPGGGSQDSIDSTKMSPQDQARLSSFASDFLANTLKLLFETGVFEGLGFVPAGEKTIEVDEAKKAIRAWHNTQLYQETLALLSDQFTYKDQPIVNKLIAAAKAKYKK